MGGPVRGPWGTAEPNSLDEAIAYALEPDGDRVEPRIGHVAFAGKRTTLMAILLRGYVLTLLTAGIYRFWLVTQKRRFYWSNTLIDGHPLEYTGRSLQLLVGFLLAILVFIPLYGGVFYLTTVFYELAAFAYLGLFIVLYFLSGYAAYRGRRFRLTRTLWRGIRFGQTGSAWVYAIKRFLWTIVTVATLGLTYPLMVVSLSRYRFSNTWFGDRRFSFTGTARSIAGTMAIVYIINGAIIAMLFAFLVDYPMTEDGPTGPTLFIMVLLALSMSWSLPFLRAHIDTQMLSSIMIGEARLNVRIKTSSLYGQYIAFGLLSGFISLIFLMLLGFFVQGLESGVLAELVDAVALFGRGFGTLILFAIAYLTVLATYALLWEIIFHFGYWKLVTREARIENVESLRSVRASHEESPNIGEGLADALNVGAY